MKYSIYLVGATGKMGKAITELVNQNPLWEMVAGFHPISPSPTSLPFPLESDFASLKRADVIIDFSQPEAAETIIHEARKEQKPLVMGTTGLNDKVKKALQSASEEIPIFYASNFSLGAYLCLKQAKYLAQFCDEPQAIRIIETHHHQKKDAPSGTALTFQKTLNEIYPFEIPIESIRKDSVVGEHKILFKLKDEAIELKHEAHSRQVFAAGALKAAEFLIKKNSGFYDMDDLIQELMFLSRSKS